MPSTLIFNSVEEFYRKFYFRPRKMFSMVGGMLRSPEVMKRRLREGVEFFRFLHERKDHGARHRSPDSGGSRIRRRAVKRPGMAPSRQKHSAREACA